MRMSQIAIVALALGSVACFSCEAPSPEPVIIDSPDTVEMTVKLSGEVNGTANDIQGGCLDGCTHGLATGTYFSGYRQVIEVWQWIIHDISGFDTLTWVNADVSYAGGTGTCDSVRFSSATYRTLDGSTITTWYLRVATLGKTGETYLISKEVPPTPAGGIDTAYGGDQVAFAWTIKANKLPSSGSYGLYDTLGYKMVQGIAVGTASPVNYCKLYYANGDTNQILIDPSAIQYANSADTSWATVQFTTFADTNRAADTVLGMHVFAQDGKKLGWDTLNVVIPDNGAYRPTFRFKVIR